MFIFWPLCFAKKLPLSYQLLLTIISVIIISLTPLMVILTWQTRNILITQTGESLVSLASSNSQSLGLTLTKEVNLLQNLSEDQRLLDQMETAERDLAKLSFEDQQNLLITREDAWENDNTTLQDMVYNNPASYILDNFRHNFPHYTQIALTGEYGQLIAVSGTLPDKFYYGNQNKWQFLWQKTATKPVFIDYINDTSSITPQLTLNIVLPVRSLETSVTQGLISAKLDVTDLALFAKSLAIDETQQISLVDSEGYTLYSSNVTLIGQEITNIKLTNLINQTTSTPPFWTTTSNQDNQTIIYSAIPLVAPIQQDYLNNLGWYVIVQQNQDHALAPINQLTQLIFGGVFFILILVIGVGYFISQYLTRPIINLTNVATAIATGQFDTKATLSGPIELQKLASAFNTTADKLQQTLYTLENQVINRTTRLEQRTQQLAQRSNQLETAASIARNITSVLDPQQLLDQVTKLITASFNINQAGIFLLTKNDTRLVLQTISSTKPTLTAGIKIEVEENDVIQTVASYTLSFRTKSTEPYSEMILPLKIHGQTLGVLYLQNNESNSFSKENIAILQTIADQVGIAISNAHLFEQNQEALQETENLYKISQQMIAATNLSELIATLIEGLSIPVINRAVLMAIDYDKHDKIKGFTIQANWYSGQGIEPSPIGTQYPLNQFPEIASILNTEPIFFDNAQNTEVLSESTVIIVKKLDIHAMVILPLWSQARQLGCLLLQGSDPYYFRQAEIRPYRSIIGQLAATVESQLLLEQTQQKAIELAKAKQAAEIANLTQSQFLGNMSHELRTPLNAVLGYTQILQQNLNISPQQQDEYLSIMQENGHHLLALIEDILELSRIQYNETDTELYITPFNLPMFLHNLAKKCYEQTKQKKLTFTYQFLTHLPNGIQGDKTRLWQILNGLIGNAIKFTKTGKISLYIGCIDNESAQGDEQIALSQQKPTKTIRFEVIDTGQGLTEEQLNKIFQPFVQLADFNQQVDGLGLGLTMSKKLVEMMGGQLNVESEVNKGSRFWFDLAFPLSVEPTEHQQRYIRNIKGYKGKRYKILVVDDKAPHRSILVNMLQPLGFEIIEATNGQEAVEKTKQMQPDLILMDLVMPVMTGLEATQHIRQLPNAEDIIIIATSASLLETDQETTLLAGCNGFMAKPVEIENLFAIIEKHLAVAWIYEELDDYFVIQDISPYLDSSVIPPSPEQINILYDLALKGNLFKVEKLALHLKQTDKKFTPFADKIYQFAKNYEEEALFDFIETFKTPT